MPSPPPLGKALDAVMKAGLPDHYRLVLVSLLRHQSRNKNAPHFGLAWPSPTTIAGDTTSVTPEKAAAALQHMAHAGILHSHSTTENGVSRWEIRIEKLGATDPLLQTMLSTRLRTIEGLSVATRNVLHELSMLSDTTLAVSASYSDVRRSLPWLTQRSWRTAIHQLTSARVLTEIRRGNRFHGTLWRIQIPKPGIGDAAGVRLPAPSDAAGVQLPPGRPSHERLPAPSRTEDVQLPAPGRTEDVQLPAPGRTEDVQLPAPGRTEDVQLPAGRPYKNLPITNRPTEEPSLLTEGQEASKEETFIRKLEEAVGSAKAPDLDTIRHLIAQWELETRRTVHPAWAEVLVEEASKPTVRTPIGYMTDRVRRLIRVSTNLSQPPRAPGPPAEPREPVREAAEPDEDEPEDDRAPPIEIDPAAHRIWSAALGDLGMQVTRPSFDTWLKGTKGVSIEGPGLIVGAPNTFTAEMLERRMHSIIVEAVDRVSKGELTEVRFMVVTGAASREIKKEAT